MEMMKPWVREKRMQVPREPKVPVANKMRGYTLRRVDYAKSSSAMDVSENIVSADDSNRNRFELPSGVTLENE
nr:guanine nucleotide-binding protein-like NSN1 [Ipomoea batatas]